MSSEPSKSGEPEELIERASRGDVDALDGLLERHLPGLRRFVQSRLSPRLAAVESGSDVVQSVCRELLSGLDGFEYRGEAAFRSWLYQAALRKLVDHRRYHDAEKRAAPRGGPAALSAADFAQLAAAVRSPSEAAVVNEGVEALERGFARLALADQEILSLVFVEGLPHAAIAEQLGCTEVSSRKQLSRALARLARLIG